MIIGIDASHLSPLNMSGTQLYLFNLLHNISLIDDVNTYNVYTKHPLSEAFFSDMTSGNPRFHCFNLPKSLSWTQVSLASRTFKDKLDVLFCPWQTMPIVHRPVTKIVSVIHGLEYELLRFGPTYYTAIFSDTIICVSDFTKSTLCKKVPFLTKDIHVVHEGIDPVRFRKLTQPEITPVLKKYSINSPYVFSLGYMVARKNIERLIVSYAKYLENSSSKVNLVLGGKLPPENSHVLKLPSKLGINSRVQFLGYVPDADVPALLSGASALSYVSLSEGFGLPPLESMACQTPVLTSNTGALPEVCGDAALFVNPYDIAEITCGLDKILSDGNLRRELINKGLMNIKNFDWGLTARKVLDIFIAQRR